MTGIASGMAPCWSCKSPFMFDPDKVPSIPIDPETNRPPDLGGDAGRAVRQPICPSCCKAANVQRRREGLPLINEEDTLQTMIHTPRF